MHQRSQCMIHNAQHTIKRLFINHNTDYNMIKRENHPHSAHLPALFGQSLRRGQGLTTGHSLQGVLARREGLYCHYGDRTSSVGVRVVVDTAHRLCVKGKELGS